MNRPVVPIPVRTIADDGDEQRLDIVAVEEPLEIRVDGRPVSITMRTPGHDSELVAGFLFGEGVLKSRADIVSLRQVSANKVDVELASGADVSRLQRTFYTTSSCGICGKASLESLEMSGCPAIPAERPAIDAAVLHQLPESLRESQAVFDKTGGLHGAALFDFEGRRLSVREDVGRHNAVDKLIGAEFLARRTPLGARLLLVSGRVSFELIQKALMAGIPAMAAVGAPSSLAVELALRFRMTLVGFLRNGRFNVYSGASQVTRQG